MTTIAFIGLGHMGHPMAENLLKAGYSLQVYDVAPQAMASMVAQGAVGALRVADAVNNADVIITMVQTAQQVKDTCLGDHGIFAHVKKEALYIDCSSIDVMSSRELHDIAQKQGLKMLDAPVSGGVLGAQNATLTFMVGGTAENFQLAEPILKNMGKKIIHAGTAGSGQAAKICNNLLLGISMIGVAEAFSLAEKLGLEAKKFYEISSNASGQCWSMTSYCPVPNILENVPSSHDYEPGFMAKMMLKDLKLGQQAADSVDALIPLGTVATELYEAFTQRGFGEKDFSAIIRMIAGDV